MTEKEQCIHGEAGVVSTVDDIRKDACALCSSEVTG